MFYASHKPDLNDAGIGGGEVEFLVHDVAAGKHALDFANGYNAASAGAVFVV
ncbi:MAG: hypothetical protein Fur0021_38800 [Candidatus Promineifilaceae bacterium]